MKRAQKTIEGIVGDRCPSPRGLAGRALLVLACLSQACASADDSPRLQRERLAESACDKAGGPRGQQYQVSSERDLLASRTPLARTGELGLSASIYDVLSVTDLSRAATVSARAQAIQRDTEWVLTMSDGSILPDGGTYGVMFERRALSGATSAPLAFAADGTLPHSEESVADVPGQVDPCAHDEEATGWVLEFWDRVNHVVTAANSDGQETCFDHWNESKYVPPSAYLRVTTATKLPATVRYVDGPVEKWCIQHIGGEPMLIGTRFTVEAWLGE
jgi:hypothetical protein